MRMLEMRERVRLWRPRGIKSSLSLKPLAQCEGIREPGRLHHTVNSNKQFKVSIKQRVLRCCVIKRTWTARLIDARQHFCGCVSR